MKAYIDLIIQYQDTGLLPATVFTDTLYTNIAKYIEFDPSKYADMVDYPFKPEFMGLNDDELDDEKEKYESARIALNGNFTAFIGATSSEFLDLYKKLYETYIYTKGYPTSTRVRHLDSAGSEGSVTHLYNTYSTSTALNTYLSGPPIKLEDIRRINEFIKDVKLFFLTEDYARCIQKDIQVRNQSGTAETIFRATVLDGVGMEPFATKGTSRWSFF